MKKKLPYIEKDLYLYWEKNSKRLLNNNIQKSPIYWKISHEILSHKGICFSEC